MLSDMNHTKNSKAAEIAEEYMSSLQELASNSKPHINMLTILAEDYIEFAPTIVEAVEAHLQKVQSALKLPVLYLIDSIIKNVNGVYSNLFANNIVQTFSGVFQKVDDSTRGKMWKLRQTWNTIFPADKLLALDVQVHNIDRNWPLSVLPSSTPPSKAIIHVNPKFLQQKVQPQPDKPPEPEPELNPDLFTEEEKKIKKELLEKERYLEVLKRQKELLVQQQKQLEKQAYITTETFPSDGSSNKSPKTTVPSDVPKSGKKEPKSSSSSKTSSKEQKPKLNILPKDPRLKTAAAIQNGSSSGNSFSPRAEEKQHQSQKRNQSRTPSKSERNERRSGSNSSGSVNSSKSSLFRASPVKIRDETALCSDISPTTANADLSLIMNDNKSLDNDRIQRSSTSSQKTTSNNNNKNNNTTTTTTTTAITAHQGDAQSGNSSERSPSRSSSTRGGPSSSSSASKSKSSSSSSSSRSKSSRSKSSHAETATTASSSSSTAATGPAAAASTSSSSTSSSPRKKSSKSRKRSRSPHRHHSKHHHHHHHTPSKPAQQLTQPQGLDEEEQFGGSLIVSPPQPVANVAAFGKDSSSSSSSRQRRESARRNKERSKSRSRSPTADAANKKRDTAGGKDEDLRASLLAASSGVVPAAAPPALGSKEDLDLRVLPPITNKRKTTDGHDISGSKKSKDELLDELFGKEDVDLRLLAPVPKKVASAHPPTPPPPPVISGSSEKDSKDKDGSWAKIKTTPTKSDSASSSSSSSSLRSDSRNNASGSAPAERSERGSGGVARGPRASRPSKLYNKNEDMAKERRRGARDYERNSDRNIEIIMKEAAEQLNQGTITKSQYNKLIQEVLHMSEDQKLRAAQRKERESKMWDRTDKGIRSKEHGMHPRPPGGPRWPQPWHQPWAHPPGPFQGHFRPEFRPMGPWQNHPRLFGSPIRPDFHNFHGGYNPRMGPPIGPNGPLMPNGPLNPMSCGPINQIGSGSGGGPMSSLPPPPGMLMGNTSSPITPKRSASNTDSEGSWVGGNQSMDNSSGGASVKPSDSAEEVSSSSNSNTNSDELPPADAALIEEIAKDTMKSISIDNVPREIRYYGHTGVIFMHWDDPRDIGFQNGARRISIDGKETVVCTFNDDYREFTYEGQVHKIKLGAPTRELYVDDKWYQCYFGNNQPITVELGNKKVSVKLDGPPPQVKIGNIKRTDLVLGKINLIINARSMVPVFLDAKPQIFHLDNKPCTLEFIDSLQTVLINGRPFNVEFGGLPKPILTKEKKHFIRFSVLPRGFRAGYVRIANMKGIQPPEETPEEVAKKVKPEVTSSTSVAVPSPVEPDSTSQDGMDHSYTSKTDLQIDVLSSVVPSAMAPSSGLSYQAEPAENQAAPAPAISLPLNLSELYQRLVETGIVSNLFETKKSEEEEKKEPEIVPVSFDKPETLKIKQPAMVTSLYSGIQCSSCGARFAPEMATRYSHHLDWHFRQNRKERDSSRKAHSRLWYYDVSDWIQFEEIEDLEDRAQSWFETEKQNMETENTATEELFDEALQPSVPTGSEEEASCQVCHEAFVQFYNDEKEEWHLRPAISFDGKNFHPLCLEDHKRALEDTATANESGEGNEDNKDNLTDSIKNEAEDSIKEEEETDESIKKEETDESIKKEETDLADEEMTEEDKDAAESALNEILDTIEKEPENAASDETTEESAMETNTEIPNSNPTEDSIQEDKETVEDSTQDVEMDTETKDESSQVQEEEAEEKEEEPMDVEPEFEESTTESVEVDSTQVEVKSTIDGNVDLDGSVSLIPAAQSKIVINITKPMNSPKEPKETKEEKEPVVEEEPEQEPMKPASIKPALVDRKLTVLPQVFKGEELSALCSIM